MKKITRRLVTLFLAIVTVFSSSLTAFAQNENPMVAYGDGIYILIDEQGNELIFPTYDDYSIYVSAHSDIQPFYGEEWRLVETLKKETKNHYFVGYHSGTPNWTPASQYTITGGKLFSVSGSYKFNDVNLNIGFSYSFSVATTIPANASRYSRLGVYADYVFKSERYAQYQYGQPTGSTRVSTYATRTNNYIEPVYQ